MKALTVGLVAGLVTVGCGDPDSSITVSLHAGRLATPPDAPLQGLSNIFFVAPDSDAAATALRIPDHWQDVAVASVLALDGMNPVYAARYGAAGGAKQYVVDTDGDLDLSDEQPLAFASEERRQIAVVDILIPPGAEPPMPSRMVPYQIVISEGARYTYARIVEDRRGVLEIDGASYDVMLRPRFRNYPFYSMSDGTVMFVDHNRDGQFDQRAALTQGGVPVASEEVSLVQPFLLDGRGFEVTHVDSGGASVTLTPVVVAQAPSVGYDAPDLLARTFDGAERHVGDLRSKVVLVEFWSTSCSFSERARPTLNEIAAQHHADGFVWLAIARETDAGEVGDFLREHPRDAQVVVADSTVWQEYNPELATPTYYVIDQDGVIRLRERGASSAEVVARVVEELVSSNWSGRPILK